jgi:hypothetical protein
MSKVTRFNGNLAAFASNAQGLERTVFGQESQSNELTAQQTAEYLRGWGLIGASDRPSIQDFNAAFYTLSQLLVYLHQMGVVHFEIPKWLSLGLIVVIFGGFYTYARMKGPVEVVGAEDADAASLLREDQ